MIPTFDAQLEDPVTGEPVRIEAFHTTATPITPPCGSAA